MTPNIISTLCTHFSYKGHGHISLAWTGPLNCRHLVRKKTWYIFKALKLFWTVSVTEIWTKQKGFWITNRPDWTTVHTWSTAYLWSVGHGKGADVASLHLLSPLSCSLFARAILQSGSPFARIASRSAPEILDMIILVFFLTFYSFRSEADLTARSLAALVGCQRSSSKVMSCLFYYFILIIL